MKNKLLFSFFLFSSCALADGLNLRDLFSSDWGDEPEVGLDAKSGTPWSQIMDLINAIQQHSIYKKYGSDKGSDTQSDKASTDVPEGWRLGEMFDEEELPPKTDFQIFDDEKESDRDYSQEPMEDNGQSLVTMIKNGEENPLEKRQEEPANSLLQGEIPGNSENRSALSIPELLQPKKTSQDTVKLVYNPLEPEDVTELLEVQDIPQDSVKTGYKRMKRRTGEGVTSQEERDRLNGMLGLLGTQEAIGNAGRSLQEQESPVNLQELREGNIDISHLSQGDANTLIQAGSDLSKQLSEDNKITEKSSTVKKTGKESSKVQEGSGLGKLGLAALLTGGLVSLVNNNFPQHGGSGQSLVPVDPFSPVTYPQSTLANWGGTGQSPVRLPYDSLPETSPNVGAPLNWYQVSSDAGVSPYQESALQIVGGPPSFSEQMKAYQDRTLSWLPESLELGDTGSLSDHPVSEVTFMEPSEGSEWWESSPTQDRGTSLQVTPRSFSPSTDQDLGAKEVAFYQKPSKVSRLLDTGKSVWNKAKSLKEVKDIKNDIGKDSSDNGEGLPPTQFQQVASTGGDQDLGASEVTVYQPTSGDKARALVPVGVNEVDSNLLPSTQYQSPNLVGGGSQGNSSSVVGTETSSSPQTSSNSLTGQDPRTLSVQPTGPLNGGGTGVSLLNYPPSSFWSEFLSRQEGSTSGDKARALVPLVGVNDPSLKVDSNLLPSTQYQSPNLVGGGSQGNSSSVVGTETSSSPQTSSNSLTGQDPRTLSVQPTDLSNGGGMRVPLLNYPPSSFWSDFLSRQEGSTSGDNARALVPLVGVNEVDSNLLPSTQPTPIFSLERDPRTLLVEPTDLSNGGGMRVPLLNYPPSSFWSDFLSRQEGSTSGDNARALVPLVGVNEVDSNLLPSTQPTPIFSLERDPRTLLVEPTDLSNGGGTGVPLPNYLPSPFLSEFWSRHGGGTGIAREDNGTSLVPVANLVGVNHPFTILGGRGGTDPDPSSLENYYFYNFLNPDSFLPFRGGI